MSTGHHVVVLSRIHSKPRCVACCSGPSVVNGQHQRSTTARAAGTGSSTPALAPPTHNNSHDAHLRYACLLSAWRSTWPAQNTWTAAVCGWRAVQTSSSLNKCPIFRHLCSLQAPQSYGSDQLQPLQAGAGATGKPGNSTLTASVTC